MADDPALAPELLPELDLGILDDFDMGNLQLDESMRASSTPISTSHSPFNLSEGFSLGNTSSPGISVGRSSINRYDNMRSSPPHDISRAIGEDHIEDLPFEFDENGEMRDVTPLLPDLTGDIDMPDIGKSDSRVGFRAGSLPRARSRLPNIEEAMFETADISPPVTIPVSCVGCWFIFPRSLTDVWLSGS